MEHRGCPHGLKFQPRKTNPFSLWAPKSFINQIAKNASSSPAFPNLWLLLVVIFYLILYSVGQCVICLNLRDLAPLNSYL